MRASHVADIPVGMFDAVFREETVAYIVAGVMRGRIPDVLALATVTDQMSVNRMACQFQTLAHTLELHKQKNASSASESYEKDLFGGKK